MVSKALVQTLQLSHSFLLQKVPHDDNFTSLLHNKKRSNWCPYDPSIV